MPKIKSTFEGVNGFSRIVQDENALARALYIGILHANREDIREQYPGMDVYEFTAIDDPHKRRYYEELCASLDNSLRTKSTQLKNVQQFCLKTFGVLPHQLTLDSIHSIQDRLQGVYRLGVFRYFATSKMCTEEYVCEIDAPHLVVLITDGVKWDAVIDLASLYNSTYFCKGCLHPAGSKHYHRCEQTCTSCASRRILGQCEGTADITCNDCGVHFNTEKCYTNHLYKRLSTQKSRCEMLKVCKDCDAVYRTKVGEHVCGETVYCNLCREYTSDMHECTWPEFKESQRLRMKKKQENFKMAFFDIETVQGSEDENGEIQYKRGHMCSTIVMRKVCYKCVDQPDTTHCGQCKEREVVFQYSSPEDPDDKVVQDFCQYLIKDPTMVGRTIYSHNGGRFDSHLVMKEFIRMGFVPKLVNKGSTLIKVDIRVKGRAPLIFKDSYCIIPMALGELPKAFELPCESKGTFPHLANMKKNWNRVWDSIPPRHYFGYKFMKKKSQSAFNAWYTSMEGKPWDQDAEILKYCRQDVKILQLACLRYREIMMEETGWCPFTVSNTLASYCQWQLRTEYLKHKDMPYLPEAGFGAAKESVLGVKYIKWLEKTLGRPLRHSHSPDGQRVFRIKSRRHAVDCFDSHEGEERITEILNCFLHGCQTCYPGRAPLVGGEPSEELLLRTNKRMDRLRTVCPNVDTIWECQIEAKLKSCGDMRKFFNETQVVGRLRPRDALYGGRVEVFRSFLEKIVGKQKICYYDIVSMEYPLGQPEVRTAGFEPVIGTKLPYRGLIKLRILPPRNLTTAVLPVHVETGLFFPLCHTCATKRQQVCTHEDEMERSWVGTYCTAEVEKALKEGYKIMEVYETWHWTRWSGDVYKGYFRKFMKMKFAASPFPANVDTDEKKADYCRRVGQKLGFTITPAEIKPSASRRTVAKLCCNSAWGKLAEQGVVSQREYMQQEALLKLFLNPKRNVFEVLVADEKHGIYLVTHKPQKDTVRSNRFSAVHHAALVTSYARLMLYDIIKRAGDGAAYCDTDSIVFAADEGSRHPLDDLLTDELGDLSDEMKDGWEIKEAVFAGSKNYSMHLVNPLTGEEGMKQALRGFTKDAQAETLLSHKNIRAMVLKEEGAPEYIAVSRPELKRKMGIISTSVQTKKYRPVSVKNATRGVKEGEYKVPYGFME